MPSNAASRRWKTLSLQAVAIAIAFAVGWHAEVKNSASPAKNTAVRDAHAKSPAPPSATELAKTENELAQMFRASGMVSRRHEMLDYVASLDVATVKALVEDLSTKPHIPGTGALTYLMNRWAELDPRAAIASLKNISEPATKSECTREIFDALSAHDPTAAVAALAQLQGTPLNELHDAMVATFQNYAQQDPLAALAALHSLPVGQQADIYPVTFQTWAAQDPSAAAAAALNLPTSWVRNQTLNDVAAAWALNDPTGALGWATSLPSGAIQDGAVSASIQAMGQQDPATAADFATSLPESTKRDDLIKNITSKWVQQDPAGLLAWADENLTGADYDTTSVAALKQMAHSDPASAAAYIAGNPDSNAVSQVISSIAYNWEQQDPPAALAWAQSLPTDNIALRNSAMLNVLNSQMGADPLAAVDYIQQNFATDPSFVALASHVAIIWVNSDPQAALNWAESLSPGDIQNSVVAAAITQLAKSDPKTAWNDALQLPGDSGSKAQVDVITNWANQQPAQAAGALSSLPPGTNLDAATAEVAQSWLSQDPNAASQWINSLPLGSARDGAVMELISSVGKNDPASAFNWAVTLSDPTARNTQVVALATQWSGSNPTAAAATVQNAMGSLTGLTPDQQTALQEVVDKAR